MDIEQKLGVHIFLVELVVMTIRQNTSMGRITYSTEQQKRLRANKFIKSCGAKYVTYTPEFRELAVLQYRQGKTPFQIFDAAGFDPEVFDIDYVRYRVKNWRTLVHTHGWHALRSRGRGRPLRQASRTLSDKEKIQDLEMRVKFLEAERDFLVKLRAKQN